MRSIDFNDDVFRSEIDNGAAFRIQLKGESIRPKNLNWIGASTAEQWGPVLLIKTPLGGIHLFNSDQPRTRCHLQVIDTSGKETNTTIEPCELFYPDQIRGKTANLSDLIRYA